MKTKLIKKHGKKLIVSDDGRVWRDAYFDRLGRFLPTKELKITTQNSTEYPRVQFKGNGAHRQVYVHRLMAECFIIGFNSALDVDHIDGDRENNDITNLRMLTRSENCRAFMNRKTQMYSSFRGVTWCKTRKMWKAQCKKNQINYNLGTYETETEAAQAFNSFAENNGFFPEALNQL